MSNEGENHKAGLCSRINVLILTQQAQSSLFTAWITSFNIETIEGEHFHCFPLGKQAGACCLLEEKKWAS